MSGPPCSQEVGGGAADVELDPRPAQVAREEERPRSARPVCGRLSSPPLSSRTGVGKTKLVQDLCIARATGGSWLGLAVEPSPALFWSGEQGRREDFRVLQAFSRGRGLQAGDFSHHLGINL